GIWGQPRPGSTSGVVDDNYIRESVLDPAAFIAPGFQPQMPSYEGQLDDRAIGAIAAYIRQINGAATPADLAPPGGAAPADTLGTADAPEGGAGDPSAPVGLDEAQQNEHPSRGPPAAPRAPYPWRRPPRRPPRSRRRPTRRATSPSTTTSRSRRASSLGC